ncbi:MAG: hypothetical protein Q9P90_18010 [candidate division KSB1 bacterium]|nr:hypothetical protein [candidate division KSB1 bacterium]
MERKKEHYKIHRQAKVKIKSNRDLWDSANFGGNASCLKNLPLLTLHCNKNPATVHEFIEKNGVALLLPLSDAAKSLLYYHILILRCHRATGSPRGPSRPRNRFRHSSIRAYISNSPANSKVPEIGIVALS